MTVSKMIGTNGVEKTREMIAGRLMRIMFGEVKATEKELEMLKGAIEHLNTL